MDSSDTEAAVDEFKREIGNNPNDVVSRLQIAAAKYKIDSLGGLPYADQAVKIDPQVSFAHYLLGLLLLDTDDFRKAIPELELAERSFPRDAKIYFALGSAYGRAGRKKDAARARARFSQLDQSPDQESGAQIQDSGPEGSRSH